MTRCVWLVLLLLLATPVFGQVDLNHSKVCSAGATTTTLDVDCTDWNADHVLSGGAQGRMLYRDTGEATGATWTANVLYDETKSSFTLFGGTVGTTGVKVFSLGIGTAPTTFPADSVQLWVTDMDGGAGTAGLEMYDERGSKFRFGDVNGGSSAGIEVLSVEGVGFNMGTETDRVIVGTSTNNALDFFVNDNHKARLSQSGNFGLGAITTFGTSAVTTFAQAVGTCPTTSPADMLQKCVADRNGAGTATEYTRDEEGHFETFGLFTSFRSTNEASVTNSTSDLHTINTNVSIPVADGFIIRLAWRKSGAGTGTVSIGLKINTTQIIPNTVLTASDATARTGYCEITVWNRAANFLRAAGGTCFNNTSATTAAMQPNADMANATITDIRVTGVGSAANVTLGVRDVVVQRIGGF